MSAQRSRHEDHHSHPARRQDRRDVRRRLQGRRYKGVATPDEQFKLAEYFNAVQHGVDGSHEEDSRTIGFRVVELFEKPLDMYVIHNAFAAGDPGPDDVVLDDKEKA
jgi:hypothetical protein